MSRYAAVFEKSSTGCGAYIPDLPGCVAVAPTLEETKRLIHEAMDIHLGAMRRDGDDIPEPSIVEMEYVEASSARAAAVASVVRYGAASSAATTNGARGLPSPVTKS